MGAARKRRPTHKLAGSGGGREAVWKAIRELREFEAKDLPASIPKTTINGYLRGLKRAGYVEQLAPSRFQDGRWRPGRYRLVRDVGPIPPDVTQSGKRSTIGQRTQQMWNTMRVLHEFSARDLSVHASTEDVRVPLATARTYVHWMHRAGYLVVTQEKAGTRAARFRLVRNSGPRPPVIHKDGRQKVQNVFDPNLGEVVWSREAETEGAHG